MNSKECLPDIGDILHSPQHHFGLGTEDSDKYLILLNSPQKNNHFILVFVNSSSIWRDKTSGCHNQNPNGHFVIDENQDWFYKPKTFVIFNNVEVLTFEDYKKQREKGNLKKKGSLRSQMIRSILNCYRSSHEINGYIKELLD